MLYVGVSNNPFYRLKQHGNSGWFFNISNVSIEWHATENAAKEAERLAIADERPIHNLMHNASGDAGDFVSAVGRRELAARLGVGLSAISTIVQKNKFPCSWARMIAQICRERGLYVPIAAFPFKGGGESRDCITTLFGDNTPHEATT